MNFKEFKFVYVDVDYLKKLHDEDNEILYADNANYEKKPHLGILISNNNFEYVIPLTSAKDKHKQWRDITSTNYRIYETIDIRTTRTDSFDIIVEENDFNKLRKMGVNENDFKYFKKRILSVLEIKKMFPIIKGKYSFVDLDTHSLDAETEQRRILMQKEYFFCRNYMDAIKDKAKSIYDKQIETGIVQTFHCNYKKLENVAKMFEKES